VHGFRGTTPKGHYILRPKRFFFSFTILVVAGCSAPQSARHTQSEMPSVRMQFASAPTQLYAAVPVVCSGPGERVLRPRQNMIECRRLLPPEGAAGAILAYDGTIDALPESVIRFETTGGAQEALIVEASAFVAVPQRSGGEVHVVYPDASVDRKMRQMLTRLGGTPVTE
jgi:hypothetical protein